MTLTAATRILVVDEVYSIPPDQWRYVELGLNQQAARVVAHYETRDATGVEVALMRRSDLENLRHGLPHGAVRAAGPGVSGTLQALVAPGDYVVVMDNQAASGRAATVSLRVWLDFSRAPAASGLSRERRLVVILLSAAVFLAIAAYAAVKLRKFLPAANC